MRRFMVFVMTLFFFFGAAQGHGAEKRPEKNPIPKANTLSETKSLNTTYHALIIGNNQYKYLPKLKTARNDAVEVEKLLKEKLGFQTELLLDATRANILGKINEIRKRLGEKDSLLIYYAGHGEYDKNVDKAYWLPVDAQRDDPTNWIIADDITSNIKRITARHVMIVSDSCYSGTLGRQAVTELISTGGREGYLKKMQDRPSRTLMASGGNEPVSDSGGGNNSVFAAAFLTALKESDKANFTAEEVFHGRIKPIVAGKSDQVPEYSSIKNSGDEGGDFVFRIASLGVEGIKPEVAKKDSKKEEADRIEIERQKLAEERARIEADKKRLEEQIKFEAERAKLAEEKNLEVSLREKSEAEKKVKEPKLSQPFSEIFSILPDFKISQPGPTDPPEVRALLGKWMGKWGGKFGREAVLIITSIDITKKRAKVIWAWGDRPPSTGPKDPGFNLKKGYQGHIAEFTPGENPIIKMEFGSNTNKTTIECVLKKDKLIGSRLFMSSINEITMTKIP